MSDLFLGVATGLFITAYINSRYEKEERWIETRYLIISAVAFIILSLIVTDWTAVQQSYKDGYEAGRGMSGD